MAILPNDQPSQGSYLEVDDARGMSNASSVYDRSFISVLLRIQEQQEYLDTTTDKGNQRLNFRFSY